MEQEQLTLFETNGEPETSVTDELAALHPQKLLQRVLALGLETQESLRRAWQADTYVEEGQPFHFHSTFADMVASNRELYVTAAQRVEDGRSPDYPAAYATELAERQDALHKALEVMRGKLQGPLRPR